MRATRFGPRCIGTRRRRAVRDLAAGRRRWSTSCCRTSTASSWCAGSRQLEPEAGGASSSAGRATSRARSRRCKAGAFVLPRKADRCRRACSTMLERARSSSRTLSSGERALKRQLATGTSSTTSSARAGRCASCSSWSAAVAERGQHPDPGRERHRQGADRQRAALQQPAREGPVHQDQLRGDPEGPDRVGAVRLQRARSPARCTDKDGLLEQAQGGSLLLDEIGEMPPYLQTKLLRVLQEREYRPIGSDRVVRVDFRLICATNVDVEAALRGRAAARGPLLPHQHDHAARAAAARAHRRHPAALRLLPRQVPPALPAQRADDRAVGLSPADPQPLAGQRARARERDRARGAGGQGQRDHAGRPARVDCARTAGRRATSSSRRTGRWPRSSGWRSCRRSQRTNWNKQEAAQQLGLYRPTLYSKMRKHKIRDEGRSRRGAARAAVPRPGREVRARGEEHA